MKNNKKSIINQSYQRNLIQATVASNVGINNKDRLIKTYGPLANRIEILNKLKKQSRWTLWWFSTFILLGAVCLFCDFENCWFNVFDLYIVMVNVYLVAKGRLVGIYIGILECFIYSFICFKTQLYGEVVKMLCISVPLNIYSIVQWTRGMKKRKKEKYAEKQEEDVVIVRMTKKQKILCGICLILVSVVCYFFLKYVLKQTTAIILGAIALSVTIVGKVMTAKQFMETYSVFIISNIIGIFMWVEVFFVSGFNFATLSMVIYYVSLMLNDIYAYNLWKHMYRKVAVNGGAIFAKRKINIKHIIKLRRQYKKLVWNKEIDIAKNNQK